MTRSPAEHPRLMIDADRLPELRRYLAEDQPYQRLYARLAAHARELLGTPPLAYELKGDQQKRLLHVSRAALKRVLTLGTLLVVEPEGPYADAYRDRLVQELLAVCAFPDWQPSKFLAAAEMALAVSLGYDWLYDRLSEEQRGTIRRALIDKAMVASFPDPWWVAHPNNWNQVCHGGLTAAALATCEDEPELAQRVLDRARANIGPGLEVYAPDGVYPEGPGYWHYGTMYSVFTAAMLHTALGTDWGILDAPGFRAGFDFHQHMTAPTGHVFNFADCSLDGFASVYSVLPFWLGLMDGDPRRAAVGLRNIRPKIDPPLAEPAGDFPRSFPLGLLWYQPADELGQDRPLSFFGRGRVHAAALRSAWDDPRAWYLGLKGGSLRANHGHLDAGGFVLEFDGVRWSEDLGSEGGIYDTPLPDDPKDHDNNVWATHQNSARWRFFRVTNFAHSTLTIDGQLQRVEGDNPLVSDRCVDGPELRRATMDLSNAYHGLAGSVVRSVALHGGRAAVVEDEIQAARGEVLWSMMTRAEISPAGASARLDHQSRTVYAHAWVSGGVNPEWFVRDADPPMDKPAPHQQSPNDDCRRLTLRLPNGFSGTLRVVFSPDPEAPSLTTD